MIDDFVSSNYTALVKQWEKEELLGVRPKDNSNKSALAIINSAKMFVDSVIENELNKNDVDIAIHFIKAVCSMTNSTEVSLDDKNFVEAKDLSVHRRNIYVIKKDGVIYLSRMVYTAFDENNVSILISGPNFEVKNGILTGRIIHLWRLIPERINKNDSYTYVGVNDGSFDSCISMRCNYYNKDGADITYHDFEYNQDFPVIPEYIMDEEYKGLTIEQAAIKMNKNRESNG